MVEENDYLPGYKIIQSNPIEEGASNVSSNGGGYNGGNGNNNGKVRFENPFGISTEDVNAVDQVCVYNGVWLITFYPLQQLQMCIGIHFCT